MKAKKELIFIVEDDKFYAQILQAYLDNQGYQNTKLFYDGDSCLEHLNLKPDIVVLDYILGLHNGLEVLKKIKEQHPETHVIMLSGQEYLHVAVKSYKFGAFDYIEKNKNSLSKLNEVLEKIAELKRQHKTSLNNLLP